MFPHLRQRRETTESFCSFLPAYCDLTLRQMCEDKAAACVDWFFSLNQINPSITGFDFFFFSPSASDFTKRTFLVSHCADPVVRHLQSLKVGAREIRSWKEARCDAVGSEGERRPVEHFFLPFLANIQHLHVKAYKILQGSQKKAETNLLAHTTDAHYEPQQKGNFRSLLGCIYGSGDLLPSSSPKSYPSTGTR